MKKLLIGLAIALGVTGFGYLAYAGPCFVNQGCTGQSHVPVATILTGSTTDQSLVVTTLVAGSNMTINTSTPGQITFSSTGGGSGTFATTTINGLSAINYTLYGTGNISIATSAPGTITIAGSNTGTISTSTVLSAGQVDFSTGPATIGNDSNFYWDSTNHRLDLGTSTGSSLLTLQGSGTAPLLTVASSTGAIDLTVLANGNVGIGTSTPTALLSFPLGTTATNGINLGDATADLYRSTTGTIKTDGVLAVAGTGNSSIAGKLLVNGASANNPLTIQGDATTYIGAECDSASSASGCGYQMNISGLSSGLDRWLFEIRPSADFGGAANGWYVLGVNHDGSLATAPLILTPTGNVLLVAATSGTNGDVGIGTTSPAATLDVVSLLNKTPLIVASSTGASYLIVDQYGHQLTGGSTPTCNGGCTAGDIWGDDTNIRVVTSSTALSTLTITFAHGYTKTPLCIATEESGGTAVVDASATPTTVVLDYSTSLTSQTVGVRCEQSLNFPN